MSAPGDAPGSAPSLPWDAGARLTDAIAAPAGRKFGSVKPERATIRLPTVAGRPIASSPLIAEAPEAAGEPRCELWSVTAVPLSIGDAVELLCACVGRAGAADGVVVGDDLAWWATAMRFAGSLVARQKFVPGLKRGTQGWAARWEPVLIGDDPARFAQLAAAMPEACRAMGAQLPATTLLDEFLSATVDHLVRTAPVAGNPVVKRTPKFDSLHAQWVHRLRAVDAMMAGFDTELAALAEHIREWRRPLATVTGPFRLCLRLDEPAEDPESKTAAGGAARAIGDWRLSYLLQSRSDPSLLVPSDKAWSARGRTAALLAKDGFAAKEFLLSALGRAARMYPPIEDGLKAAVPAGQTLNTTEAHAFLTEHAAAFAEAGYGLMLPAWWTGKGTKVRLGVRAKVKSGSIRDGGSGLTLDEIVKFDVQVSLGGETLTQAELAALAKLKEPLVRFRGRWVELSADEIRAAAATWKDSGGRQATVRDLIRMTLGAVPLPGGLPLEGLDGEGPVGELLAQLDGRVPFTTLAEPENFKATLRPYQRRGYSWLEFLGRFGLGACLADDMGLGKTVQTLAWLQRRRLGGEKRPALLICPTSVVGNWLKEAKRFAPDLSVLVHHGSTRAKGTDFARQAERSAIVVSSYALLHRDLGMFSPIRWSALVLDEAQNIKNAETKQSAAARLLRADARIALTGTPVENNVGDLWSLMEFLNPGFLGTKADFRKRYFLPIQAQGDPEAAARLRRATGPFILRRLKTDKAVIADLPEKVEGKVFCTLTKEQASLYEAVTRDALAAIGSADGMQRRGLVLAVLSKLKQVCNHPAQFLGDNSSAAGRSGKLARLTEMLEEVIAEGDRALVFTQFSEMGAILKRHLQETFGREVLFLHGGTTKKQRDAMVERFGAAEGAPPIFLLSLKAGGTGLNLVRASHVFHFDRWWNPAAEDQATDRAFRIGQTKNVLVHKFLCVGTMEEKIDEMIERKKRTASQVVGSGEGMLTELSTAELKDVLSLRREAVQE